MGTGSIWKDVSPIVVVRDSGQAVDEISVGLSDAEWHRLEEFRDEKRQRHFVIGRLAARLAIRRVLGPDSQKVTIEVRTAKNGAPRVLLNGRPGMISVSLSHSGRVAAACAWRTKPHNRISLGVDVERLRPSDVYSSPYAFSRRERTLLSRLPIEKSLAGITAWSVKEATWKAVAADLNCGPESIEIRSLDLNHGFADVQVSRALVQRLGRARIRAQLFFVHGPDRRYVISCAVTVQSNVPAVEIDAATAFRPVWARRQELSLFARESSQGIPTTIGE
jgi:phosphopantetheinyl transferase